MANVLLVCFDNQAYGPNIRVLSSIAGGGGHKVWMLFLHKPTPTYIRRYPDTPAELAGFERLLDELDIGVVGLTVMTHEFARAVEVSKRARKKRRHVLWGGIHPTVRPLECLEHADAVCIADAEGVFVPYLDALDAGADRRLPSFVLRGEDPEEVRRSGRIYIEYDLDSVPFPDYEVEHCFFGAGHDVTAMAWDDYRRLNTWEGSYYRLLTSRGCMYHCSYCMNNFFWRCYGESYLRRRSPGNCIEELVQAREKMPFIRGVNIQDDSFFMGSDEWLDEFIGLYKAQVNLPFVCRLIPKYTNRRRLALLADAGLLHVEVGLQTGSRRMAHTVYERFQENENFLEVDVLLSEYGVTKTYDTLVDNVYETPEDVLATLDVLMALKRPYYIGAYSLTPFPGTEYYDKVVADGLVEKMADAYNSPLYATDPEQYYTPKTLRRLIEVSPYTPNPILRYCRDHWRSNLVEWLTPRLMSWRNFLMGIVNWGKNKAPWFLQLGLRWAAFWGRVRLGRAGKSGAPELAQEQPVSGREEHE
jgi:anaerobic magnesium-protoporphyrin IX monomethyl ester cyclase